MLHVFPLPSPDFFEIPLTALGAFVWLVFLEALVLSVRWLLFILDFMADIAEIPDFDDQSESRLDLDMLFSLFWLLFYNSCKSILCSAY